MFTYFNAIIIMDALRNCGRKEGTMETLRDDKLNPPKVMDSGVYQERACLVLPANQTKGVAKGIITIVIIPCAP